MQRELEGQEGRSYTLRTLTRRVARAYANTPHTIHDTHATTRPRLTQTAQSTATARSKTTHLTATNVSSATRRWFTPGEHLYISKANAGSKEMERFTIIIVKVLHKVLYLRRT